MESFLFKAMLFLLIFNALLLLWFLISYIHRYCIQISRKILSRHELYIFFSIITNKTDKKMHINIHNLHAHRISQAIGSKIMRHYILHCKNTVCVCFWYPFHFGITNIWQEKSIQFFLHPYVKWCVDMCMFLCAFICEEKRFAPNSRFHIIHLNKSAIWHWAYRIAVKKFLLIYWLKQQEVKRCHNIHKDHALFLIWNIWHSTWFKKWIWKIVLQCVFFFVDGWFWFSAYTLKER